MGNTNSETEKYFFDDETIQRYLTMRKSRTGLYKLDNLKFCEYGLDPRYRKYIGEPIDELPFKDVIAFCEIHAMYEEIKDHDQLECFDNEIDPTFPDSMRKMFHLKLFGWIKQGLCKKRLMSKGSFDKYIEITRLRSFRMMKEMTKYGEGTEIKQDIVVLLNIETMFSLAELSEPRMNSPWLQKKSRSLVKWIQTTEFEDENRNKLKELTKPLYPLLEDQNGYNEKLKELKQQASDLFKDVFYKMLEKDVIIKLN
jgi:hypothetical protein